MTFDPKWTHPDVDTFSVSEGREMPLDGFPNAAFIIGAPLTNKLYGVPGQLTIIAEDVGTYEVFCDSAIGIKLALNDEQATIAQAPNVVNVPLIRDYPDFVRWSICQTSNSGFGLLLFAPARSKGKSTCNEDPPAHRLKSVEACQLPLREFTPIESTSHALQLLQMRHWIDRLGALAQLKVQLRLRDTARAASLRDNLTPTDPIATLHEHLAGVGIS